MRSTLTRLTLLLSLGLTGCAPSVDQQSQSADFRAEGKLAARSLQDTQSAQFVWQQFGEQYDIRVSGPAGLKAAQLTGDERGARFRQGEIDLRADSADELAERLLGFPAPASALRYWLIGEVDPSTRAHHMTYDQAGRLQGFEQHQWQVELSNYQTVNGRELPGRIRATQRIGQITFIVKDWQWGLSSGRAAP